MSLYLNKNTQLLHVYIKACISAAGEMIRECVKARLQSLGGNTTEWTPRWKDNRLVIGSGPGGKKGRVYSCGFSEEGLSYAQRALQM